MPRELLEGSIMLWNPATIILDHLFSTPQSVIACFKSIGAEMSSFVTNVYGLHNLNGKIDFLNSLQGLEQNVGSNFWILGGDFKTISSLEEKKGGTNGIEGENDSFHSLIQDKISLISILSMEFCHGMIDEGEIKIISFILD
jgi:hypothetical protein